MKKLSKFKLFIRPAVIALVLGAMLLPVLPASAQDSIEKGQEIASLRTESSKTFNLGGGYFQWRGSVGAIHYKDNYTDKYETWKDIDLAWNINYIGKAPYELWVEGNKITIRDKRTLAVSTVELLEVGTKQSALQSWEYSNGIARIENVALDTDLEIVVGNSGVRFSRILKSALAPTEASFRIIDYMPFTFKASDVERELPVEIMLKDGITTETLKPDRPIKYPARIDPTWQVGVSSDDCFRAPLADYFDLSLTWLAVGYDDATWSKYISGMRFTNITIPQGGTIDEAYLTLRAFTDFSATVVNSKISAEDVDDAPTFTDDGPAFDTRFANRTTAKVNWDAIPAWTANVDYNSPEIKTVIQEIVDRGGWASGQDIVIFWDDFEQRSTHSSGTVRLAYQYDGSSTYAPKLVIDYTQPEPDISNIPSSNAFGTLAAGTTSSTAINKFTITNNSGVAVSITIESTDMTGGDDTWTLSNTATPGLNIYGLKAGLDDADDNFDIIIKRDSPYNTLVSGLADEATTDWGAKLYMPTSWSGYDGQQMTATVTLVATID